MGLLITILVLRSTPSEPVQIDVLVALLTTLLAALGLETVVGAIVRRPKGD